MCAEKKTCACRHAAATDSDEFECPMSRGERPPEPGPNTKCDKREKESE